MLKEISFLNATNFPRRIGIFVQVFVIKSIEVRIVYSKIRLKEVFFLDIEGIIFFLFSRFSKFFSPPCIQACMGWTRERVVVGAHCRAKRASCLVANHRCWDELGHDLAYDFFVNHRCRHQHSLCSTTGIQYGRYI